MPKVIIDGIEYIPARQALANRDDIARGLLRQFYGECSEDCLQDLIDSLDIKVLVHDWDAGGEPLNDVLNEIAKEAQRHLA